MWPTMKQLPNQVSRIAALEPSTRSATYCQKLQPQPLGPSKCLVEYMLADLSTLRSLQTAIHLRRCLGVKRQCGVPSAHNVGLPFGRPLSVSHVGGTGLSAESLEGQGDEVMDINQRAVLDACLRQLVQLLPVD